MRKIKLTNLGVIILIILLALNIVILLTGEPKSGHASKTIQYKVTGISTFDMDNPDKLQIALNQQGSGGWELIQLTRNGTMIFKK
jgi:hypothetical protein